MLLKTILVFLLGMVLIGMIGKALFPGAVSRGVKRIARRSPVCTGCGRYVIGKTCDCGKKG